MDIKYEAFAWLQAQSDFDLNEVETQLEKRFSGAQFLRDGHALTLVLPDWTAHLFLAEESHIMHEAQEYASWRPDTLRVSEIALCTRRVEVLCSPDNSDMAHFNDFVFVCEALSQFNRVILVDPQSGELI